MKTNPEEFELAKGFTVQNYWDEEDTKNRKRIAQFIRQRFSERYIDTLLIAPRKGEKKRKSAFTIMAVCCLMIEALESFRQGWSETPSGMNQCAFCYFFDHNNQFRVFRGRARDFYKNIRCGILHQAETTGGWRLMRKGPLVDFKFKTINADRFLEELTSALECILQRARVGRMGWRVMG